MKLTDDIISKPLYSKLYDDFSDFLTRQQRKYHVTSEELCRVVVSYIEVNTNLLDNNLCNSDEDTDNN